jgi:hypothetical protein
VAPKNKVVRGVGMGRIIESSWERSSAPSRYAAARRREQCSDCAPEVCPVGFPRGNEIDLRLPASLSLMCWPRMDLPVPALPYRGRGTFARSRLWVAGEGESLLSRKA